MGRIGFWDSWDDRQKETAVKIFGLFLAVLAVYTFFTCLSYLFTWKADQSLLTDPEMMSPATAVHNGSGKLGFRLGRFLICDCFGLGSFALVFILVAAAARVLSHKWRPSLLKTAAVMLSGAFVVSLILSYFASLFGPDTAFGGGLGGRCGAFVTGWSNNLFGRILTFFFLALVTLLWLLLISPRFSRWISSLGEKKPVSAPEEESSFLEVKPVSRKPVAGPEPAPAPPVQSPWRTPEG